MGRVGAIASARPRPASRRRTGVAAALACAAYMLSACTPAADDPVALSADEDRQLNQAAARLDSAANAAPADTVPANESSEP
jgi:hypothetical protein